jgi:hypothetical protein
MSTFLALESISGTPIQAGDTVQLQEDGTLRRLRPLGPHAALGLAYFRHAFSPALPMGELPDLSVPRLAVSDVPTMNVAAGEWVHLEEGELVAVVDVEGLAGVLEVHRDAFLKEREGDR